MSKKEKPKKAEKGDKPEEAEKPAAGAEGAEGEAPAKKKMAGKTLVLFIILPAVLVIGGGGAAAAMLLGGGKKPEAAAGEHGEAAAGEHGEKKKPEKKAEKKEDHGGGGGEHGGGAAASTDPAVVGSLTVGEEGDPSYYTMPKLIVNLAGSAKEGGQLLELSLVLEASDPSMFDHVPTEMPRLKDQFQSFLRELRVEDLNGSAGSYRLRVELLRRFNTVMAPAKADAVLIESFLVMAQ